MMFEFVAVGEMEQDSLRVIGDRTAQAFGASCIMASERLPLACDAFDPERRQYRGGAFLAELMRRATARDRYVLGVAQVDLYAGDLNLVSGQAQLNGRAGVRPVARLRPKCSGEPAHERPIVERSAEETVHELGHVPRLRRCRDAECGMHFSNGLVETEHKGAVFCDRPAPRLAADYRGGQRPL